jgi:membrane-associated protein
LIHAALDLFLHLDKHLNDWAGLLGPWLTVVLFAIVFCETGLVVTPYLPGDSLLFAVGALSAQKGSPINLLSVMVLMSLAAVLGDAVNYGVGAWLGPKIFLRENSRFFKKEHLQRTHRFYEKYGGKTIVLARFIPIVRTFAPFVAGIGKMSILRFAAFNVFGGALWAVLFLGAGHRFANLPVVREHFHYVILAIVVLSIIPAVVEYFRTRREL